VAAQRLTNWLRTLQLLLRIGQTCLSLLHLLLMRFISFHLSGDLVVSDAKLRFGAVQGDPQ
jgi:hypothetical protein